MNIYLVKVTADIPYPWPKEYAQEATNEGTAIARALKAYRVDVRKRSGRSKKIDQFSIRVSRGTRYIPKQARKAAKALILMCENKETDHE